MYFPVSHWSEKEAIVNSSLRYNLGDVRKMKQFPFIQIHLVERAKFQHFQYFCQSNWLFSIYNCPNRYSWDVLSSQRSDVLTMTYVCNGWNSSFNRCSRNLCQLSPLVSRQTLHFCFLKLFL